MVWCGHVIRKHSLISPEFTVTSSFGSQTWLHSGGGSRVHFFVPFIWACQDGFPTASICKASSKKTMKICCIKQDGKGTNYQGRHGDLPCWCFFDAVMRWIKSKISICGVTVISNLTVCDVFTLQCSVKWNYLRCCGFLCDWVMRCSLIFFCGVQGSPCPPHYHMRRFQSWHFENTERWPCGTGLMLKTSALKWSYGDRQFDSFDGNFHVSLIPSDATPQFILKLNPYLERKTCVHDLLVDCIIPTNPLLFKENNQIHFKVFTGSVILIKSSHSADTQPQCFKAWIVLSLTCPLPNEFSTCDIKDLAIWVLKASLGCNFTLCYSVLS